LPPLASPGGRTLGRVSSLSAFREKLERDRVRLGLRVGQAAWLLGISVREYRELVDGDRFPDYETWSRMCSLFGWPA
jgi:hypothetical protein